MKPTTKPVVPPVGAPVGAQPSGAQFLTVKEESSGASSIPSRTVGRTVLDLIVAQDARAEQKQAQDTAAEILTMSRAFTKLLPDPTPSTLPPPPPSPRDPEAVSPPDGAQFLATRESVPIPPASRKEEAEQARKKEAEQAREEARQAEQDRKEAVVLKATGRAQKDAASTEAPVLQKVVAEKLAPEPEKKEKPIGAKPKGGGIAGPKIGGGLKGGPGSMPLPLPAPPSGSPAKAGSTLGPVAGGVVGFILGGPLGAAIGAGLGVVLLRK